MFLIYTNHAHENLTMYFQSHIILAILCVAFHLYAGPILQPRSCEIRLYNNNKKDRPLLTTAHAEDLDSSYIRNNRIVIRPCGGGGGGLGWVKNRTQAHSPGEIRVKNKINICLTFRRRFFFFTKNIQDNSFFPLNLLTSVTLCTSYDRHYSVVNTNTTIPCLQLLYTNNDLHNHF